MPNRNMKKLSPNHPDHSSRPLHKTPAKAMHKTDKGPKAPSKKVGYGKRKV
jgi:hypothetical protein